MWNFYCGILKFQNYYVVTSSGTPSYILRNQSVPRDAGWESLVNANTEFDEINP